MKEEVIYRLKSFIESEARSCSMDFGCVTAEYVHRMWGGTVTIEEIATGLKELRKEGFMNLFILLLLVHIFLL